MTWQNRIVGHAEVAPADLIAHDHNWRTHPIFQSRALLGVIEEVGFVRSVTVNKRTGRIIDGHLRVHLAIEKSEATIPVEYVDLTDEEELEVLATFDPLAALADSDHDQLQKLLENVDSENDAVRSLLAELEGSSQHTDTSDPSAPVPSALELQPYEHYDYVMVLARNSMDFMTLCAKLGLERANASALKVKKKIGLGRCISAEKLLALLP